MTEAILINRIHICEITLINSLAREIRHKLLLSRNRSWHIENHDAIGNIALYSSLSLYLP